MKCPICGKDVELQKKQVGTSENGDPIFNEYAICRDCKKQWNLDKQRAKKMAARKAAEEKKAESAGKSAGSATAQSAGKATEKAAAKSVKKQTAEPAVKAKASSQSEDRPVQKPVRKPKADAASREIPESSDSDATEPLKKKVPVSGKKAVRKRSEHHQESNASHETADEEQRYGNIPPEHVRAKKEKAVRQGYEDMLAAGEKKKPVRKKRVRPEEDTETETHKKPVTRKAKDHSDADEETPKKPVSKKSAARRAAEEDESSKKEVVKKKAPKKEELRKKKPEPEPEYDEDEYDDEDYDDTPRFKIVRIILGILSLVGFAFFVYRGFVTGLNSASDGSASGTTYIILALCMLVAAILYFILQNRNTIFAFLLPMLFYLGSTVVAFVQRGDDMQLLISAIVSAVLAVLSLILAIASRGGDDYDDEDEDYDDPFEEEHDN